MNTKPVLIAVFAHPDDEAFGPAGYLIKATKKYDVHCVCVTNGARGKNDEAVELKQVRKQELLNSAGVLGIHNIHFLHFEDGDLSNGIYKDIVEKIGSLFDRYKPEKVLTFEPLGVSGHLDHIAVTSVVTYLFHRKDYIKELVFYAMPYEERILIEDYFVHMPPGYKRDELDLILNIEDVWEQKVKAMYCHTSQKSDADWILNIVKDLPREEHFLIQKKLS